MDEGDPNIVYLENYFNLALTGEFTYPLKVHAVFDSPSSSYIVSTVLTTPTESFSLSSTITAGSLKSPYVLYKQAKNVVKGFQKFLKESMMQGDPTTTTKNYYLDVSSTYSIIDHSKSPASSKEVFKTKMAKKHKVPQSMEELYGLVSSTTNPPED